MTCAADLTVGGSATDTMGLAFSGGVDITSTAAISTGSITTFSVQELGTLAAWGGWDTTFCLCPSSSRDPAPLGASIGFSKPDFPGEGGATSRESTGRSWAFSAAHLAANPLSGLLTLNS